MNATEFHSRRQFVETPSGRIAYVDVGHGPVALFVHGVPLNGFHWRHAIDALKEERRCIALDLMGLGYTEISPTQDVTFTAQAQMLRQFLDALGIDRIDLVGNDSGGGISQIFAANNPQRVRTLTLTNCDVHDHWPPQGVQATVELARNGTLAAALEAGLKSPHVLRAPTSFGAAYSDPSCPSDEALHVYIDPLLSSHQRAAQFHRFWSSFDSEHTIAIKPKLEQLEVPTLLVWALADVFFGIKSAHWLRDTIPGVVRLIELPDAKLFFPEDQPQRLIEPLQQFWWEHSSTSESLFRSHSRTSRDEQHVTR